MNKLSFNLNLINFKKNLLRHSANLLLQERSFIMEQLWKFKNDRKIKLLLILIMMDQSGRIGLGELNGSPALPGTIRWQSKMA